MLVANINLAVPPLPDNQVWFANSAAWSNYWKDINVTVTFVGAVTDPYVPSVYVLGNFVQLNIDGNMQAVPDYAQHVSLVAQVAALDTNYRNLKAALVAAGFITQA